MNTISIHFQGLTSRMNNTKNKETSIMEIPTNELGFHILKEKIATILVTRHKEKKMLDEKTTDALKCKCIYAYTCWTMEVKVKSEETTLLEDRVSNVCLMMLNFLIVDGEENVQMNLNRLFDQAIKYTDRNRNSDEIFLEIITPIYALFFESRYMQLKNELNYTDPFLYGQRRFDAYVKGMYFFDDNEMACGEGTSCYNSLGRFVTTLNDISVGMAFPWEIGFGSLIANFNYLLDICKLSKYSDIGTTFQEHDEEWSGFYENTKGMCEFDKKLVAFYEDMAVLTPIVSQSAFQGIYLNDLIGFLGYSPKFDITTLKDDEYESVSRNLHPIYGMDRWFDRKGYDWKPCLYRSTYQRWAALISASMTISSLRMFHNLFSYTIRFQ